MENDGKRIRKTGGIYESQIPAVAGLPQWTILVAILIFDVLIIVHELGHYIFARIFKVGIIEFSIGMGPKLFGRTSKKTGIAYSVRLLPIGDSNLSFSQFSLVRNLQE